MRVIFLHILSFLCGVGVILLIIYFYPRVFSKTLVFSPVGTEGLVIDRVFDKYSIDSLSKRSPNGENFEITESIATTSSYLQKIFSFKSDNKKVTGLINLPHDFSNQNKYPVIIQLRGYVDREIYESGIGTKRSGEVFAANGFITIAPDFLGYGGSDNADGDVLLERFKTYTTLLDLYDQVIKLPFVDSDNIFLWAHSNGGQIALTFLSVTQKQIPTVLWAPVTKRFPYSVLYFTDELPDHGKFLRHEIAKFEALYDIDKYTFVNYLGNIKADIELHQGTADDAVPVNWSDEFVSSMEKVGNKVSYFKYAGADHNVTNTENSWGQAVGRSIEFYNSHKK